MSNKPEYPLEIQQFLDVLESLPGVHSLDATLHSLSGITVEDLSLLHVTKLPLGVLRHMKGGQNDDGMIQFEFRLEADTKSWKTLEFLAWFIRDLARTDTAIQLRPFGLPPFAAGQVQLGHTLRFHIDLFFPDYKIGPEPVKEVVQDITSSLELAKKLYGKYLYE